MDHFNITCDGCGCTSFSGKRFKCLRCPNYDLCNDCYEKQKCTADHLPDHPVQVILDRRLRDIHFAGEEYETNMPNSFTCPYCCLLGYSARTLIEHVISEHRKNEMYVICPLCAGTPNCEPEPSKDLARHLLLSHIQHANFLDHAQQQQSQQQQQNQQQQAIARRGTGRIPRRNRRRVPPPLAGLDTEPALDILFQLSELRRARIDLSLSALQHRRRASVDAPELLDPLELPDISSISSAGAASRVPAGIDEAEDATNLHSSASASVTSSQLRYAQKHENDHLFLLRRYFEDNENPPLTAEQIGERNDRTCFVEQLLLSALASPELSTAADCAEDSVEISAHTSSEAMSGLFNSEQ